LRGRVDELHQQLLSKLWVSGIITGHHNGESTWQVSVNQPETAEAELLKLLVNGPVVVTEFRRKKYELEDVFLQVIEGGQNVRQ
jgi:hypothetical protein